MANATSSNQVACVYPAITEHAWATAMGLLCGKTGGSAPTVALAIWNLSAGNPGSLRGSTATFTPSNTITNSSTGQAYTASFATPLQLYSGTAYALGFDSTANGMGYVMSAAANFANGSGGYTQPTTFYFRDRVAQPPNDPMGYTSSSTEGVIDVWVVYTANRAPTAALVAPSGTITSATPTIQYSFTDADATAGLPDKLNTYGIQVRRKSDQVSFLNKSGVAASGSEQSGAQTSYVYDGTALVPGTVYQSRGYVTDQFNAASAWTGWTDFTVNAGGTVTVTGPSGKQGVNTGITFSAEWTHASSLSTNAVQIQLLQNNTVVQDSGTIAKVVVSSAAPGTAFTITFAAAGFSTLAWDAAYTYQIRGRDSGNLWSPYSTPQTAFTTDYHPLVPTKLSPANGLSSSSLALLTATMTDPDDTAAGTLTNTARVKGTPAIVNAGLTASVNGFIGSNGSDVAGATGAISFDTVVFPAGGLKAAITPSTALAGVVYHVSAFATLIPVVQGQTYTVRGTIQTDTANLHPLLQFRWYNAALAQVGTTTETDWAPAINTAYPRSFSGSPLATAVYVRVGIALNTAVANVTGNAYLDAISVDQCVRTQPAMAYNGGPANWTYQTALGVNDAQTISVTGTPTGGSFTVNVDSALATIAFNSSAASAQTALTALDTVGSGNMTCTGGPLPGTPIVCTWGGAYAGTPKNLATIGTNSLTGGSSPTPAIAHTTSGVPSDITTYGTYAWDCAGNDGTLQGSYPTQATFVYGQGPTVVVTAPAASSTQTTATPTVTWTATGQVKYRIQIYLHNTTTLVYDSGTITSAVQSVAVPGGYLHGSPATDYDIVVSVTNATPLTGANAAQLFTVNFTAPSAPTNFTASPAIAGLDAQASAVMCSWDQSVYSAPSFVEYILDRRLAGTDAGDASTVILARKTSISDVSYTDYLPVADQTYTYSLRQQITQGTDVTESGRTEDPAGVSLIGIVICAAAPSLGGTYRAVLSYVSARKYDHYQDTALLMPWGATAPTILIGTQDYRILTGTFSLIADSVATASSYAAALVAMRAQRMTVCVRDERDQRMFGVITQFTVTDARFQTYTVELQVTESSYVEGVG